MTTLPTKGRALIQTTLGDIEIELWAKVGVQPKAEDHGGNKMGLFRRHLWLVVIFSLLLSRVRVPIRRVGNN